MDLREVILGGGMAQEQEAYRAKQAIAMRIETPTLAQRVAQNIAHYEQEIQKLREIETLLTENPQIERLINALGNVNIRY